LAENSGDVNGDTPVDPKDAVLTLQILSGIPVSGVWKDTEVDGDDAIGVGEVICILQNVGSVR
jgi:hypothetical protein